MTPERWQQIRGVYNAAADLPLAERGAYLNQACSGDDDMRRELITLMETEAAHDIFPTDAGQYGPTAQGRRIGPYRILREIGAGGMGSVFLAERVDEFPQQVALKLMHGGFDSPAIIARFRHERQILALFEHPNVARLLDGGETEDGRPYFVLEYVEGLPIDTYCERNALSIADRLRLFRHVCAAVQYAHQSLIVHRDIKPGNILVTADGVPKLLDFGIAKILRADGADQTAGLTQSGMRMMTPQYASPEQVMGLPVTTATDVYSLGVVLYRMLAGKVPYDLTTQSPSEMDRIICQQDPPRPSTIHRELMGDVDTIVLKALEKDPQRRYPSVEQFSEDIRRHLEGLPISARPQTLVYRAQKFVRRNRTLVVAAALFLVTLVGGLIATVWEAHIARQERALAQKRFADVRQLTNSFLFEFHDKIKDIPGTTEARRLVVSKALEYLDRMEKDSANDTGLQLEIAEGYSRLGDVQGNPYVSNIGDPQAALISYDKSSRLAEAVLGREPGNVPAQRALARSWQKHSDVLPMTGKVKDGVAAAKEAVKRFSELAASHAGDTSYLLDFASSLEALGDVAGHPGLASMGDYAAAADAYRRSLDVWKPVLSISPNHPRAARGRAVLTMKLGDLEMNTERLEAARTQYTQALEYLAGADQTNAENTRLASSIRRKLAYITSYTDMPAAVDEYRKAVEADEKLVSTDPKDTRARMDLAITLREMGEIQESMDGKLRDALVTYQKTLEQLRALLAADPENIRYKELTAEIHVRFGRVLTQTGDAKEGARIAAMGLQMGKELADRPGATSRELTVYAEALLRVEPASLRDPETALRYAQLAQAALPNPNPTLLDLMAEAHYQAGRPQAAMETEQKALNLLPAESAGRPPLERHLKRYSEGAK